MAATDLVRGYNDIRAHEGGYAEAKCYYEGDVTEVFAHPKMQRRLSKSSQAYKTNFAKAAVNSMADRLEITSMRVPNDDATTLRLRKEVVEANQLDLWMLDIFQKTGAYGDGYFIVWPRTDAEGVITGVKVDWNSPERCRAFYDEEDTKLVKYVVKWWPIENGKRKRANVYYADRVEKYVTAGEKEGGEVTDWEEFRDDPEQEWPMRHDYGMNVFHLRTTFTYGRPDHYDAYGPQNALNKATGAMMDLMDYQSAPQRWALLEGAVVDQKSGPREANLPAWNDEIAQQPGQPVEGIKFAPNTLAKFSGVKNVGQWEPGDPANILEPADWWAKAMAQTTETPMHRMFPTGDRPSGESLRVEEAPLVKRVEHRQQVYGATIVDMLEFALWILTGQKYTVEISWKPAASYDDEVEWTVAKLKQDAGVPMDVALMEAGYEPEVVAKWMKRKMLDIRIQQGLAIAQLATQLATAVSLGTSLGGILSAEQAQGVLAQLALEAAEVEDEEDQDGDE